MQQTASLKGLRIYLAEGDALPVAEPGQFAAPATGHRESGFLSNNDSLMLPSSFGYCAKGLGIRVIPQAEPEEDT